jgi:hypothetical protein
VISDAGTIRVKDFMKISKLTEWLSFYDQKMFYRQDKLYKMIEQFVLSGSNYQMLGTI